MDANNLESVDERLAAINLDHRDLKWVAGFYRKGIKVASPCYFDGVLELVTIPGLLRQAGAVVCPRQSAHFKESLSGYLS